MAAVMQVQHALEKGMFGKGAEGVGVAREVQHERKAARVRYKGERDLQPSLSTSPLTLLVGSWQRRLQMGII